MKIVINKCFGGFSLSYAAVMAYAKRKGFKVYAYDNGRDESGRISLDKFVPYDGKGDCFCVYYSHNKLKSDGTIPKGGYFSDRDIKRDDPDLVAVVDDMGERANGRFADLKIIDIPDGIEYEIDEYDGQESVHEKHESWS